MIMANMKKMKMMMKTKRKKKRRKSIVAENIIMLKMWWWLLMMMIVAATTTTGSDSLHLAHSFVLVSSMDAAAAKSRMKNHHHARRKQEQDTAYTTRTIQAALSSSSSSPAASLAQEEEEAPTTNTVLNGQEPTDTAAAATTTTTTTAVDTIIQKVMNDVDHGDDPVNRRKRRLAVRMAFLTGMCDVALTCQFQSFCTMLTGALLWMSKSVVQVQIETLHYFGSIILCYMTGIAMARSLRRVVIAEQEQSASAAASSKRLLRIVGTLVMILFTAADVSFYTMQTSRFVPMSLLAIAYGLINSMGTDFAGTLTFVVTGHLTKLTHFLTDSLLEQASWQWRRRNNPAASASLSSNIAQANVEAAKMSLQVLGGFTAGAMLAFYLHIRHNLLLRSGLFTMLGLGYGMLFFTFEGKRIRHWWNRRQSASDMEVRRPLVRIFSLAQAKQKVHEAMARMASLQQQEDDSSSSHQKQQQQQQQQQHDVVLRTVAPKTSYNLTNMVLEAINDAVANDTNVVLVMPAAAAAAVVAAPSNVTATSGDNSLLLEEEDAPSPTEVGSNQEEEEDVVVFVLQDNSNATTASLPIDDIVES